jgi:hypothetical protein
LKQQHPRRAGELAQAVRAGGLEKRLRRDGAVGEEAVGTLDRRKARERLRQRCLSVLRPGRDDLA